MKPYKYAELYHGASKKLNPTLSKDWFVFYYYLNPLTGRFQRFIKKDGINRLETIKERQQYAKDLIRIINQCLDSGELQHFTSFTEKKYHVIDKSIKWALTKKQWSDETMQRHLGVLRIFEKAIGDRIKTDLSKFGKRDAREALEKMLKQQDVGNSSYNRYKSHLHGVFQEFVDWEIIAVNPFNFRGRKLPEPEPIEVVPPKDIETIVNYLEEHKPGLLTFIMAVNMTLVRPGEILKLKDSDIFKVRTDRGLSYRIKVTKERVKNKRTRIVIIPHTLWARLRKHVKPGHYLFGRDMQAEIRNRPITYGAMWRQFQNLVNDAHGLNIKIYHFKHMGVIKMLGEMNQKAPQYQSGHSHQAMTDRYSRGDATIFAKELEKFKGNFEK